MLSWDRQNKSVAIFGGVYSNYLALESVLKAVRGIDSVFCLGDLGAFGPLPDRACEILRETGIPVVQGNYDNSVGNGLADCQCGYTDPRDNYFAKLSYDYTFRNTSSENKAWLRTLPAEIRIQIGPYRVLLCHGSPRKMNEFLWETTTSSSFLNWMFERYQTDIMIGTHTGLHWHREPSPGKHFINCGAIGRPPNDGETTVVYTILTLENKKPLQGDPNSCISGDHGSAQCIRVDFFRLAYDFERLVSEMISEGLPEEFTQTIRTGWWTTCTEILPAKERSRGIY